MRTIRVSLAALAVGVFAFLALPAAHADNEHFRGCLVGTKDNYLLRTDGGEVYRLRDHPEFDLRSHLGDFVDIKGHFKDGDREHQAQAEGAAAAAADVPKHAIDVSHVETISHGCAEVKNGVAVIVPGKGTVVVAPGTTAASNGTVVVAPGQTTTANTTVVTPGLPQSGVVVGESGEPQHVVGCLVGTDDFYVLKGTDGTLYRLRSESGLRDHIGEMVDVVGRLDNSKREVEAQNEADLAARVGVSLPQLALDVLNVKTISTGCSTTH